MIRRRNSSSSNSRNKKMNKSRTNSPRIWKITAGVVVRAIAYTTITVVTLSTRSVVVIVEAYTISSSPISKLPLLEGWTTTKDVVLTTKTPNLQSLIMGTSGPTSTLVPSMFLSSTTTTTTTTTTNTAVRISGDTTTAPLFPRRPLLGHEQQQQQQLKYRKRGVLGFVIDDNQESSSSSSSLNSSTSSSSSSASSASSSSSQQPQRQSQQRAFDTNRWNSNTYNGNAVVTSESLLYNSQSNANPILNRSPTVSQPRRLQLLTSEDVRAETSPKKKEEKGGLFSLLWLPWIPTKAQIDSLKVTELKQACQERGLKKMGNKLELQVRLWQWSHEQQQERTRLMLHSRQGHGYPLSHWSVDHAGFSSKTNTNKPTFNTNNDDTKHKPSSVSSSTTDKLEANSLAEWVRTVNLQPLLQRREKIHKDKWKGKTPPTSNNNNNNNNKWKQKQGRHNAPVSITKEELTKLFDSSDSPYSNYQVKQLYAAAKNADQAGDRAISKQILYTLKDITPNDARIFRRLARMELEEENVANARKILQEGLRLHPENAYLWQGLGQLEMKVATALAGRNKMDDNNNNNNNNANNIDAARKCFQKAIRLDPTFPNPYHAWGTLEHTQGRIANAMKTLKKGIEYCPTNHRLHHALGDLYREAKMLEMAELSYKRALEYGPEITSSCFAYSALANVAYEQNELDKCRRYLQKSISINDGRHAQGWVAYSQLEESEGNISAARALLVDAITQYEKGLITRKYQHGKRFLNRMNKNWNSDSGSSSSSNNNNNNGRQIRTASNTVMPSKPDLNTNEKNKNTKDNKKLDDPIYIKNQLLKSVPLYRSGDHFLKVYLNLIRLEIKYGTEEDVDEIYSRASIVFPNNWILIKDWALYHVKLNHYDRARVLFTEACKKASNRHADPYRVFAEFEMSLGNYHDARTILYRGAHEMSNSPLGSYNKNKNVSDDGFIGLFYTWAVCEWYLNNLPRSEILFDHALRLTTPGEDGSKFRSYILYAIAKLEYNCEEYHLAQHCIGLCLKERGSCGEGINYSKVFELWSHIAKDRKDDHLFEQCNEQMQIYKQREQEEEEERNNSNNNYDQLTRLLVSSSGIIGKNKKQMSSSEESNNNNNNMLQPLMRRDPWYFKIFSSDSEGISSAPKKYHKNIFDKIILPEI